MIAPTRPNRDAITNIMFNETVTDWSNQETALAWEYYGDYVAAEIGCHPENPAESIDCLDAQRFFWCDGQLPEREHHPLLYDFIMLCILRVDWQQIADHLNHLARPTDATGPLHKHYVAAHTSELFTLGVGEHPAEARLNAIHSPSFQRWESVMEIRDAIRQDGETIVLPATEKLAETISNGTYEGWAYINGVGCTWEEAQEAE